MTTPHNPARKKVVVLAAAICCFAAFIPTLTALAVRHNIPAAWVVIPATAVLAIAVAYLVVAFFALKRAS
jgi:hypothetical protein